MNDLIKDAIIECEVCDLPADMTTIWNVIAEDTSLFHLAAVLENMVDAGDLETDGATYTINE